MTVIKLYGPGLCSPGTDEVSYAVESRIWPYVTGNPPATA